MKILLQTLFFFLLVTQICFAQWEQQFKATEQLWSVDFTDPSNGCAVGSNGTILRTSDGGLSWLPQVSGTTNDLSAIKFVNQNTGWIIGSNGTILKTTDTGLSWSSQTGGINTQLRGLSFIDKNTGWITGNSTLKKTTDGGTNWISIQTDSCDVICLLGPLFFIDENKGWMSGSGPLLAQYISKSTDGGTKWSSWLESPIVIRSFEFVDSLTGWAAGWGIAKTTDGGVSWVSQSNESLNSVRFLDHNIGWAVGYPGVIIKTIDGGANWIIQTKGVDEPYTSVDFVDANNGWVVGGYGTILHTTNGGNPVPVELNSFTATANGKEVTLNWSTATELNNQGFEVQRKFGDNSFATIGSVKGHGTTTSPNNYTYVDKLFDAGKYFYRLKQIDFGGKYEYSQLVEINWSPFTTYKLEQNYPNPFNPTTKISWQSLVSSRQVLKVFDVLGNEIAVLVDEEREAGYHSIDFNASDLPSGVYFYQLRAGAFVETKKMLLLR
jgi:photosystem II stability/assembly factor-like uncharacterized protein